MMQSVLGFRLSNRKFDVHAIIYRQKLINGVSNH